MFTQIALPVHYHEFEKWLNGARLEVVDLRNKPDMLAAFEFGGLAHEGNNGKLAYHYCQVDQIRNLKIWRIS